MINLLDSLLLLMIFVFVCLSFTNLRGHEILIEDNNCSSCWVTLDEVEVDGKTYLINNEHYIFIEKG